MDERDERGRFAAGNAIAQGNPHARQVARFRAALLDTITPEDVQDVAGELVRQAKAGERWAVVELLDRLLGRSTPADLIERIERLETMLADQAGALTKGAA